MEHSARADTGSFTTTPAPPRGTYVRQMLRTQVAILAYIDVFYVLAVVAVILIPLSLSLRSVERGAGAHAL